MKIHVNDVKVAPKSLKDDVFMVCVFGEANENLKEWAKYWDLEVYVKDRYTNFLIKDNMPLKYMFESEQTFDYVDGFSPNLNKNLHIGHLSNLVLAKAFQGLGIGNAFIAIFGDTLQGNVKKETALFNYQHLCETLFYKINKSYYASEMKLKNFSNLFPGEGNFATTKVFDIDGEKMVGIKSDGSTTYFYQDVALIQELNPIQDKSILYLTGLEQDNHFKLLNKLYPTTKHIGLGLVLFNGKKMSSSEGNVVYIEDLFAQLSDEKIFGKNINLVYNVVAGIILKSDPSSDKNIDMKTINNVKQSTGLYVSYTMARMHSAGIELKSTKDYVSSKLKYLSMKSKINLKPHILYGGLIDHCEKINKLYRTHKIIGNSVNAGIFQKLSNDMMLGVKELGLLEVKKV